MSASSTSSAGPLLAVDGLQAWYGESHILHGMQFDVGVGEVVTLLGRNGAGRTTTLRALLGLVDRREGSVRLRSRELSKLPPHRIARMGIGYCPEERGIFASLSAEENLMLPPTVGEQAMSVDEIYEMFPNLRDRRKSQGSRLSGGEQQMLALARILRAGAPLLLLDEITEGLAPVIIKALGRAIHRLRDLGYTIVMVEQNFRVAAPLADRHYVVERGRVVETVDKSELTARMDMLHEYLGV
jgi:branched-chain amino acid transport system ATP-binding protein